MKFFLVFSLISLTFFSVSAQSNFSENDGVYIDIPSAETSTSADIASYINKHFDSQNKKVAAIYSWIIRNITYDADSIHYVILDEDNEERVTYALRRKKGVCENFAAIFNDLCFKCGIPSFYIEGFTKQLGGIDRTPHVWCAAFVDGQWNFYDPTWDAGYVRSGTFFSNSQTKFFKISPQEFIQTHLPFDPLFQFLNYPVSYREFVNGDFDQHDSKRLFNYKDSIEAFKKMDKLSQYLSTISRIKKEGWPASKIDTKLKRVQLEVEVITQDTDMSLYDSAVEDYNKAVQLLNSFIVYRNNQFQPAKTNNEIENDFKNISNFIASADLKLKKVNQSKATLLLDTGDIQKKLDDLSLKLKDQESFFKNNFNEVKTSQNTSK